MGLPRHEEHTKEHQLLSSRGAVVSKQQGQRAETKSFLQHEGKIVSRKWGKTIAACLCTDLMSLLTQSAASRGRGCQSANKQEARTRDTSPVFASVFQPQIFAIIFLQLRVRLGKHNSVFQNCRFHKALHVIASWKITGVLQLMAAREPLKAISTVFFSFYGRRGKKKKDMESSKRKILSVWKIV